MSIPEEVVVIKDEHIEDCPHCVEEVKPTPEEVKSETPMPDIKPTIYITFNDKDSIVFETRFMGFEMANAFSQIGLAGQFLVDRATWGRIRSFDGDLAEANKQEKKK